MPVSNAALRSIPAWAGKPLGVCDAMTGMTVHPRVGGETSAFRAEDIDGVCAAVAPEVHPRVGGETEVPDQRRASDQGPSPRGRGNPQDRDAGLGEPGSIPAWAGKPR